MFAPFSGDEGILLGDGDDAPDEMLLQAHESNAPENGLEENGNEGTDAQDTRMCRLPPLALDTPDEKVVRAGETITTALPGCPRFPLRVAASAELDSGGRTGESVPLTVKAPAKSAQADMGMAILATLSCKELRAKAKKLAVTVKKKDKKRTLMEKMLARFTDPDGKETVRPLRSCKPTVFMHDFLLPTADVAAGGNIGQDDFLSDTGTDSSSILGSSSPQATTASTSALGCNSWLSTLVIPMNPASGAPIQTPGSTTANAVEMAVTPTEEEMAMTPEGLRNPTCRQMPAPAKKHHAKLKKKNKKATMAERFHPFSRRTATNKDAGKGKGKHEEHPLPAAALPAAGSAAENGTDTSETSRTEVFKPSLPFVECTDERFLDEEDRDLNKGGWDLFVECGDNGLLKYDITGGNKARMRLFALRLPMILPEDRIYRDGLVNPYTRIGGWRLADDAAMAKQECEAVAWAVVREDGEDHQQKWAKWEQKARDERAKVIRHACEQLQLSRAHKG